MVAVAVDIEDRKRRVGQLISPAGFAGYCIKHLVRLLESKDEIS